MAKGDHALRRRIFRGEVANRDHVAEQGTMAQWRVWETASLNCLRRGEGARVTSRALRLAGYAAALILAGCATPVAIPEGPQGVSIETPQRTTVQVVEATAYQYQRETVIYGSVRFPDWMEYGTYCWRIDVVVRLPDGHLVEQRNVRLIRESGPITLGRWAHFVSDIVVEVPAGSVVRVTPRRLSE